MDENKVREAIEDIEKLSEWLKERRKIRAAEHCDTAIEALEKQLPNKPIEVNDAYTPKIGEFRVGTCPNCLAKVSDVFNVCLDCGQRLEWGE